MNNLESISLAVTVIAVVGWFLAFGAAMGSFLNVIVYRMPRGLSVVSGGSRCPKCANPIRLQDNVPVIGWLRLRGRCRACGQPISARYPAVEGIAALLTLTLFAVELIGGWNLPGPAFERFGRGVWRLLDPPQQRIAIFVLHWTLIYLLLGMGLIHWDRRRVPRRLVLIGLAIAAAVIAWQPGVHLTPLWPGAGGRPFDADADAWWRRSPAELFSPWELRAGTAALLAVTGAGAGALLAAILEGRWRPAALRSPARTHAPRFAGDALFPGLLLAGFCLGWQATLAVAVLVAVYRLALAPLPVTLRTRQRSEGLALLAAAFIFILCWRLWTESPWLPGPHAPALVQLAALGVVAAAGLVAGAGRSPRPEAAALTQPEADDHREQVENA